MSGDLRRKFPITALLSATLLSATVGASPLAAERRNPFAYTMKMTPEEGQIDPAIEKHYTVEFDRCQKAAVITRENAACFDAEFTRQDTALNRIWKETNRRLKAAAHGPLLAAQRKWISERDPFCRSIADGFKGGTIAPVVYSNCRVEQTIRRTIWLEGLH
ncbi:hypothetical protein GCM10009087_41500 [Sphingomonas oligophenolica]|uniref:Lysozyme inhibitor LprI family protein n=1 Tax=Sphingomonas oligophenolica TaxID=301154 RepID=A0ABU9YBK9_9SPHN